MIDDTLHNAHLDGDTFLLEGNEVGILLIHGFTATTAEVRLLADFLHTAGYTIHSPLLPGHGTSLLDLQDRTWEEWIECAENGYQVLKEKSKYTFVGGESMGGLLALYLASVHPEISAVFAFAPAVKVRRLWSTQYLRHFKRFVAKKNMDDGLLWKGYKYHPIKAGYQLYHLQRMMQNKYEHIQQPVYISLGGKDVTIDNLAVEKIFRKLPSNKKSLTYYQNSGHCLILDKDWKDIAMTTKTIIENIHASLKTV